LKLTNTIRDAFIRAVMDDVPFVDHKETIRKAVLEDALLQAPAFVRKAWPDEDMRRWLETATPYYGGVSVTIPYNGGWASTFEITPGNRAALEALVKKKDHDEELRADLHAKIKAVAYSVSTRKALADALPEFEKYLPADDAKAIRTLPVVANVVTDFMKAGWPKEQVA